MEEMTPLYNDLRMYGKFVGQIELDVNIHQKFFEMDGNKYSVTMKSGQVLCICQIERMICDGITKMD